MSESIVSPNSSERLGDSTPKSCTGMRERTLSSTSPGSEPGSSRRRVPEASRLGKGPQDSGVFARFEKAGAEFDLLGLDDHAAVARNFGPRAGLIAATRQGGMPVWVVTAGSEEGLPAIVPAMTPELLAHHYAAVVFDGRIASIPLPGGGSR